MQVDKRSGESGRLKIIKGPNGALFSTHRTHVHSFYYFLFLSMCILCLCVVNVHRLSLGQAINEIIIITPLTF